jgi:hypothetical protein
VTKNDDINTQYLLLFQKGETAESVLISSSSSCLDWWMIVERPELVTRKLDVCLPEAPSQSSRTECLISLA